MIRTASPAATGRSNRRPGIDSPITANGSRLYALAPSVSAARTA